MRKFVVIAASLALAGTGLLAGERQDAAPKESAPKAEADKQPGTKTAKKKTVVVERHGDGRGFVYSWDENGDHLGQLVVPGLMDPAGPRIGVSVANLDEAQAKTQAGVLVTEVREDGPAAKAGVRAKDVITEFDGEHVRSARQLQRLIGETPPGRAVPLVAMRDGQRVEMQVTPENDGRAMMIPKGRAMPDLRGQVAPWDNDRMPRVHPGQPREFFFKVPEGREHFEFRPGDGDFDVFVKPGRGRLGVGVQDLSDQLAEYFGTKDGVLVTSVTQDSAAAKAGLRAGDVITSVDGAPVTSADELTAAVRKADDGAALKLGYIRDKKPATTTATLEARRPERAKERTRPI